VEPGYSGIDPWVIVDCLHRCITVSDGEPGGEREHIGATAWSRRPGMPGGNGMSLNRVRRLHS